MSIIMGKQHRRTYNGFACVQIPIVSKDYSLEDHYLLCSLAPIMVDYYGVIMGGRHSGS